MDIVTIDAFWFAVPNAYDGDPRHECTVKTGDDGTHGRSEKVGCGRRHVGEYHWRIVVLTAATMTCQGQRSKLIRCLFSDFQKWSVLIICDRSTTVLIS